MSTGYVSFKYISENGSERGPFTVDEVRSLYIDGEVTKSTLFSSSKDEMLWVPLSESEVFTFMPRPPSEDPPVQSNTGMMSVRFSKEAVAARKSLRIATLGRSQRTASQKLLRAPIFDVAQYLWIENEDDEKYEEMWSLCSILSQDNTILELQNLQTNEIFKIDMGFKQVMMCNDSIVSDMVLLTNIHEPGLIYNIQQRYQGGKPFSFIGPLLVAVNHLQPPQHPPIDPSLPIPLTPHPAVIAEGCYRQVLIDPSKRHTIVISGESGAGKTSVANMVCNHLVSTAHSTQSTIATKTEQRLLRSATIFEAFGNAKTSHCPSSSRFVKYLKIFVDRNAEGAEAQYCGGSGGIRGAAVDTFLLEKSRVTAHRGDGNRGEHNFNIFYEVLAAWMDIGQREGEELSLTGDDLQWNRHYRLLHGECVERDDLCKSGLQRRFAQTEQSLAEIGFDERKMSALWSVIAAVILLGEVSFDEEEGFEGPAALVSEDSINICYTVCRLLGIQFMQLVDVMTRRMIYARGECFVMALSAQEACHTRDAMCTSLYHHVFWYVVSSVNESMWADVKCHVKETAESNTADSKFPFIGILDMFGVERNGVNGLDHLFINYCNEVLQNEFYHAVFENEVNLLTREGMECPVYLHLCPNNSECVNMIHGAESGDRGILGILDTASRCPKPTDKKFCRELHKVFGLDEDSGCLNESYARCFLPPYHTDQRRAFVIRHFTGAVQYTVGADNQWVSGNIDAVPDDLCALLKSSSISLLHSFSSSLGGYNGGFGNIKQKGASRRPNRIVAPTLASQLSLSMKGLVNLLQSTVCSHILCIKPHATLKPGVFDQRYVAQQIRSLGCVKACEVMKFGFPERLTFVEMKALWSHLFPDVKDLCADESDDIIISLMLQSLGISGQSYKLGKSYVFLEKGGIWRVHLAVTEYGRDFNELLQHFRDGLESRRQVQWMLQEVKIEVTKAEKVVTEGKEELDALQQQIAASLHSDSSGISAVSVGVHVNEMHAAVEGAACIIELAETKFFALQQYASGAVEKRENSLKMDGLRQQLHEQRGHHDAIMAEYERLDALSTRRISNRLQDGALDRWQASTKIDDLMKSARACLGDMERAICRCQSNLSTQIGRKCRDLILQAESSMQDALTSARHSVSLLDNVNTEQAGFLRDTQQLVDQAEKLTESVTELVSKCDKSLKSSDNQPPSSQSQSHINDSAATNPQVFPRAGSMRLSHGNALQLSCESSLPNTTDIVLTNSDSDDDFALIKVDMWIVPEGWEEVFDIPTQTPYYFNTITQMSQWERPTEPAQSIGGQVQVAAGIEPVATPNSAAVPSSPRRHHRRVVNSATDVALEEIVSADLQSPRHASKKYLKRGEETSISGSNESDESLTLLKSADADASDATLVRIEGVTGSKKTSQADEAKLLGDKTAAEPSLMLDRSQKSKLTTKCTLTYGRITTNQLDKLGVELKRGFLLIKEGFLSRWKKRYFVLEGSRLFYYRDIDGYYNGSSVHKVLTLNTQSITAYTAVRYTFSVKSSSGHGIGKRQEEWRLVAESEETMRQWVVYINAHIHYLHRKADVTEYDASVQTSDRHWFEGVVETSFWRLPGKDADGAVVPPLRILSMPSATAPRTGETIYPEEYMEAVQVIETNGALFLRLADDRGWVKVQHPKSGGELVVRARECIFQTASFRVVVDDDQVYGLAVCFGPGDDSPCTGQYVWPGEAFNVNMTWRYDAALADPARTGCRGQYAKLADGRGWVRAVDSDGRVHLHSLS